MKGIFVTGTDTDIGKTLVCSALASMKGVQTHYWKPVQTGDDCDTETVCRLSGIPKDHVLEPAYRFALPASPHHAAHAEASEITLPGLLTHAEKAQQGHWIVEGAGGLLVPLSTTLLMTDLIRSLGLPTLVVSSTRLGTINQTLLTLNQLDTLGLETVGVIMMGAKDESALSGIVAHHHAPILAQLPHAETIDQACIRQWGEVLRAIPKIARALGV